MARRELLGLEGDSGVDGFTAFLVSAAQRQARGLSTRPPVA